MGSGKNQAVYSRGVMKVILVCGARPNFMKIAPLLRAMQKFNGEQGKFFEPILVHTGQHYDYEMSRVFFEDLELPEPDIYLGVGSGTHAEQTGRIMIELERVLFKEKPDLVIVVGDVNSTLAAALATVKLRISLAHVEAGLRINDIVIPEEVNRRLTDAISDYLFVPGSYAGDNLKREGIDEHKIFLVGNIMVDSLLFNAEKAKQRDVLIRWGLLKESYAVLTLHRQENVDDETALRSIISAVEQVSQHIPVIFPAHPRTQNNIKRFNLWKNFTPLDEYSVSGQLLSGIHIVKPLGYLDFLNLEMNARLVMTDSGGIQAETTILNVPCLTLRSNTEWPITVTQGTNTLAGTEPERIKTEALRILNSETKQGNCPELWDGKTAERTVEILSFSA